MSKPRPQRHQRVDPFRDPTERHWSHWLTRAALALIAAVVVARVTTSEILRNPFDVFSSSIPVVRGAGPAEGLALDLLAGLAALLVLLRRVVDRDYTLRFAWSAVQLLALGAWAVLSTLWADDRFTALVSSCHFLSAFVLLWATAQVVDSWLRLRLVAAVCFGLLLVMIGHAINYRFVETPRMEAFLEETKQQATPDVTTQPDTFAQKQFASRVGQLYGFTKSANSFAAVVVLLCVVSVGLFSQRLARRREEMLPDLKTGGGLPTFALAAALAAGAWVLWMTDSRTGWATAALAVLLLVLVGWMRPLLARRSKSLYFAGVGAFLLGVVAVVGCGLATGGLVHISLTFRWRYWLGAAQVFAAHPLLGVGYEGFGTHYLVHRLPIAPEEITDPHDLFVRVFTELGLIGGILLIAWLLRLWWELTRPATPLDPAEPRSVSSRRPVSAIKAAAAIGAVGMLIAALAGIDFAQAVDYIGLRLLDRVVLLGLFVLGMTIGLVRAAESADADDRRAPWILYGCLAAAGIFLIHNLVDFSFFEPGPLFLFSMITGAALGARTTDAASMPTVRGRRAAMGGLAVGGILWLILALAVALPVAVAESDAAEGDDYVYAAQQALAAAKADRDGGNLAGAAAKEAQAIDAFRSATALYNRASNRVRYNADYVTRAAKGTLSSHGDPAGAIALLDRALAIRPMDSRSLMLRAGIRAQAPAPHWPVILTDYRRAVELNPCDVDIRRTYADALSRAGDRRKAQEQLRQVLAYDDQLPKDEQERLSDPEKAEVRSQIEKLGNP